MSVDQVVGALLLAGIAVVFGIVGHVTWGRRWFVNSLLGMWWVFVPPAVDHTRDHLLSALTDDDRAWLREHGWNGR